MNAADVRGSFALFMIIFILNTISGVDYVMALMPDRPGEENHIDLNSHSHQVNYPPSPENVLMKNGEKTLKDGKHEIAAKGNAINEKETLNDQPGPGSSIPNRDDNDIISITPRIEESIDQASHSHPHEQSPGDTGKEEEFRNSHVSEDTKNVRDIIIEKAINENMNTDIFGDDTSESRDKDPSLSNDEEVIGSHEKFNKDKESEQEEEPESVVKPKKQRYFPLLYTFGTLFNSFLAEFGDVSNNQDIGYNNNNSTEKEIKNSSAVEVLNDTNVALNTSDSGKKTRFQCALRNVSENIMFEVKIVNSTELLEILNSSKNQKMSPCVLVMFYAPWCYFCARTAPHYNALARAFPQLNILAVDTSHFSYLNARFGTVAVPNVMLFHSRSAVRFNHTTRDLDHFIQFVNNNTGLEPNKSVSVEAFDSIGPLSSQVELKRDWLLWVAWTFVVACSTYGFVGSLYGQAFIARVRVLWQEHQHIE